MERVADYIVQKICDTEIEHIFLITGRGILFLTDAVAREKNLSAVSTYHEQGASFAAMSYASICKSGGACLVSTGCAATNAITAVLCAWQDNLPVIFISGNHMLNETTRYTGLPIRTYGSQETDIIKIVEPITKYAVMLTDPKDVAVELEKAIYFAHEGRPGPVWIDVPLDIQNARIEIDNLEHFVIPQKKIYKISVSEVAKEISKAERPILFLGGGVRSADAISEVKTFIEKIKIPVAFTPSAADVCGSANKLSVGAVGSLGGSRAGNFAVQNADFILAVGTRLCSQTTGDDFKNFAREAKIFAVDIDPEEHKKVGVKIDSVIVSDAKIFLQELLNQPLQEVSKDWQEKCLHWKETFSIQNEEFILQQNQENIIDLYSFADKLTEVIPQDATVITDAGFESLIIPSAVRFSEGQRCLFPKAQGAMGYAIPAILGAHFAGRKNIIAVVGDGSVMMNIQELQIIKYHKIPAKIFVINNNMYAVIRKRQKDLFHKRTIGNDPSDGVPAPNFEKIADCFGLTYKKIQNLYELNKQIEKIILEDDSILCEVICTTDQKYFHKSFAKNEKGRIVRRPPEDLSPFLDREKFKTEMLIDPVD